MKREITGGKIIKAPRSQVVLERQFASLLEFMIDQISERVENQAILKLNKSTVQKFQDAQVGNYASVFLSFANKARRMLMEQFTDERLKQYTDETLRKVDRANAKTLYDRIERAVGVPAADLQATEGMSSTLNALKLETQVWIENTRNDAIEYFINNALTVMAQGKTLSEVVEAHHENTRNRKNHAKFVARQQMATYNSLATKLRAQNVGITEAVWIATNDDRTRKSHKWRDGRQFKLDTGLYSLIDGKTILPGIDFGCRCTYDLVIPDE